MQREKKKIEDTGRVIIKFIRNLSRTLSQVKKNTKKIFSIFNICKGTFTEPLTFILDENLQDINDKVHYDNEEQSNKW